MVSAQRIEEEKGGDAISSWAGAIQGLERGMERDSY
jgi:hypothetical protein